jgi:hypothetical protein
MHQQECHAMQTRKVKQVHATSSQPVPLPDQLDIVTTPLKQFQETTVLSRTFFSH